MRLPSDAGNWHTTHLRRLERQALAQFDRYERVLEFDDHNNLRRGERELNRYLATVDDLCRVHRHFPTIVVSYPEAGPKTVY